MNSKLRVHAAQEQDASALEALAKEIWEQHYSSIIGEAQVSYMLDRFQSKSAIESDIKSGSVYYLAVYDGAPCGYCAIKREKRSILLSKLYVKQGYRRKGVARAMLDKIYEYAKKTKSERVWLTCNKNNLSSLETYKTLGFEQTGSLVTDIGSGFVMDDYVLEKKLV